MVNRLLCEKTKVERITNKRKTTKQLRKTRFANQSLDFFVVIAWIPRGNWKQEYLVRWAIEGIGGFSGTFKMLMVIVFFERLRADPGNLLNIFGHGGGGKGPNWREDARWMGHYEIILGSYKAFRGGN